jgi:hypothetical protein
VRDPDGFHPCRSGCGVNAWSPSRD